MKKITIIRSLFVLAATAFTTLVSATSDGGVLARTAIGLLAQVPIEPRKGQRVRLCGISTTNLESRHAPRQLGFDEAARAKGERLGDALDKVTAKFGKGALKRAILVKDDDDQS